MDLKLKCVYTDASKNQEITIKEEDIKTKFSSGCISPMALMSVSSGDLMHIELILKNHGPVIHEISNEEISVQVETDALSPLRIYSDALSPTTINTKNWSLTIQSQMDGSYTFAAEWHPQANSHPFTLAHYDDGKQRCDSHEVSVYDKDYGTTPDLSGVIGYGSNYEEAFDEFRDEFNTMMNKFMDLYRNVNNNSETIEAVKIDRVGLPVV